MSEEYQYLDNEISTYQRCRIYNRISNGENPKSVLLDYVELSVPQYLLLDQMLNHPELDMRLNNRQLPEDYTPIDIINNFFKVRWKKEE